MPKRKTDDATARYAAEIRPLVERAVVALQAKEQRRAADRQTTQAAQTNMRQPPAKVRRTRRSSSIWSAGRSYIKGVPNDARCGTFREYMLRTIQAHTNEGDARRAHVASGEFGDKRLDFNWAAKNGYIIYEE